MEVIWQVEIDEYCRRVLEKHWPGVPRFRDVRDVTEGIERPDLICGGFPCQPVSVAGFRLEDQTQDERWLWPEFARVIHILRPRWIIVENVPGLLIRGFGDVLKDLAKEWYDAVWGCICASQFGYPHKRKRLFIIAYPKSDRQYAFKVWDSIFGKGLQEKIRGTRSLWPEFRRANSGRVLNAPDPRIYRGHNGLPTELDKHRIHALGNAVVPQIAEWIGRIIMDVKSDD